MIIVKRNGRKKNCFLSFARKKHTIYENIYARLKKSAPGLDFPARSGFLPLFSYQLRKSVVCRCLSSAVGALFYHQCSRESRRAVWSKTNTGLLPCRVLTLPFKKGGVSQKERASSYFLLPKVLSSIICIRIWVLLLGAIEGRETYFL